ncbi:hypothetical protein L916_03539, partial [Phytophthora nicotianae]
GDEAARINTQTVFDVRVGVDGVKAEEDPIHQRLKVENREAQV